MEMTTMPMAAAKAGWDKLASGTSLLNVDEIPVVQGEFADAINDLLAQARTYLSGFSTAATEMSTAASESTDEETKLADAPTENQLEILGKEIQDDSQAGRDWSDKAKELREKTAERKRAVEELDEAAGQSQSQQECVGIPEVPVAGEGGDVENPSSEGEKERGKEKDEAGEGDGLSGGEGEPVDPSTDIKLPLVVPKDTGTPISSDAVGTGLSADIAPTPAATPTPTAQVSPTSFATPQMPQVQQQPMMAASASPTPTSSAPNPMSGIKVGAPTADDLRKRMRDAERKSQDEDSKKREPELSGEVTGAAAVMAVDRGTSVDGVKTAAATTGAGVNTPTNVSSANGVNPNNPGQNPNQQRMMGGMGGGMMGAPPMGSGQHATAKNNDLRNEIMASDPPNGLMDSLDRSVDNGLIGRHSANNPSKKLVDA